jgi:hypothetical protein
LVCQCTVPRALCKRNEAIFAGKEIALLPSVPRRDRLLELLSQLLDSESSAKKFTLSETVMTYPIFLYLVG